MLDTPTQDKLYGHLHVLNACEQFCIIVIMGGGNMYNPEYDLKVIMYPAYDTPQYKGKLKYPATQISTQ